MESGRWNSDRGNIYKWLSHDPISLGHPNPELRVSDLIDHNSRQWGKGKIYALFAQRTCREILAIPLSNLHTRDSLIWMENKSRTFPIKTAYQVAVLLKHHHDEELLAPRRDQPIWKKIWTLNVPPKVRTFLWRA